MSSIERDLRTRMTETYHTAMKASADIATVAIHVGPDVWDELQEMVKKFGITVDEKRALCWGFPVVREAGWEPDAIQVRTTRIIL